MSNCEHHVAVQDGGLLALPPELCKRHHLDDPGAQVLIVERDDGVIELHPLVALASRRALVLERALAADGARGGRGRCRRARSHLRGSGRPAGCPGAVRLG